MKKVFLLTATVLTLLMASSCKSQKTLSEAAIVADPADEVTEVTPIQYAKPVQATASEAVVQQPVQQQVQTPVTPAPVVVKDRTEKVYVVDNGDSGKLKGFNVIVGSFGSKTNAENQKNKMINRGYRAFLVKNESGMYRVVAASFDTREAATSIRDDIRSKYATETGTCAEAWLLIPQR
ncbi:MAG: SPOR domain-containing protein [Bacteroidales bacterium]|jgi:cell division protein FtsN|nr:SPOR domain-containing protein [Bacteroidales bacterium]